MGCKYCTSGLARMCQGPNGIDDLEAACTCECHAENRLEFQEEEEMSELYEYERYGYAQRRMTMIGSYIYTIVDADIDLGGSWCAGLYHSQKFNKWYVTQKQVIIDIFDNRSDALSKYAELNK